MGFRKMIGERRASSGPGDAGFRIDDDGVGLHEILGEQWGQLQNGCCWVTARRGYQFCFGDGGSMQFGESVDCILQQIRIGMRCFIPLFIDSGIREPVVGAEIHHQFFAGFEADGNRL